MRKDAPDRLQFNDMVWEKKFRVDCISKKFKKFRFHHEVVTDGVSAPLFYSREVNARNPNPLLSQLLAAAKCCPERPWE